jgi:hypothetical protein
MYVIFAQMMALRADTYSVSNKILLYNQHLVVADRILIHKYSRSSSADDICCSDGVDGTDSSLLGRDAV